MSHLFLLPQDTWQTRTSSTNWSFHCICALSHFHQSQLTAHPVHPGYSILAMNLLSFFTGQSKKKSPLTWWKNPSWSSFWKSCWTPCVCWKAASENAREGKSADWLSSVHCCSDWLCQASLWGPWSRWSVLSAAPSLPFTLPTLRLGHPVPTNMPGISSFLPERWCLPSANRRPPQLWAHRCEPMNNTCFSQAWLSMPIITPTLFGLCPAANPNT